MTLETSSYAALLSLLAGSVRALLLWRASIGVEVVNVAVLSALAEGRGPNLEALLRGSGSAPYLDVAFAVAESALGLRRHDIAPRELRRRLERDAQVAVVIASRRLRRHAWLDYLALCAVLVAGIDAIVSPARASAASMIGVAAATLLWYANVRGARSIATRAYAGVSALVDSLVESLDRIPLQPEPE